MKKLTYLVVLYLSSDAIALSVTKDTFLLNQRARTNARKRHWFLQVTADNENSTSGNSTRSVNCNVPAMKRRQKSRGYPLSAYEFDTVPPKSRSRRQTRISSEVAKESSMLVLLTRNILEIFKEDEARLLAAGDCISNQVRILVKESRGAELLTMLYDDPYIGIVDLLYERGEHTCLSRSQEFIR
eukprot:scaffold1647_cov232-Chaetoceros_neogracile.AAC.2